MFVRFRKQNRRLQVSLLQNNRRAGKIQTEHIASLGSVDADLSVRSRLQFWAAMPERMARLGNRVVDPGEQAKILGALHARIPMVTPDEQRAIQRENAESDVAALTLAHDLAETRLERNREILATYEASVAKGEKAMESADPALALATERVDRLARGEDVMGGLLSKPLTIGDVAKQFNPAERRRYALAAAIYEAGGVNAEQLLSAEIEERHRKAEAAAYRAVARMMGVG